MPKSVTEFQKKEMSRMHCGKGAFQPLYTGRTDNFAFAFAHKDNLCSPFKNGLEPSVPYDAHDELDDTGERQGRAA